MLENEQGVPLPPVYWPNPPRQWQILPHLLREHALVNPLRVAIHQYIDTAVANLGEVSNSSLTQPSTAIRYSATLHLGLMTTVNGRQH